MYRGLAIRLMQSSAAQDQLDPEVVLAQIPEDWALSTDEYDLVSFLASLFDQQMTKEENVKIAANLGEFESFNAEKEKRQLEAAYLVIREDQDCLVCHQQLGHKKIRIFPHGMAFHMRCAKNPNECPITKQRFDIDPTVQQNSQQQE